MEERLRIIKQALYLNSQSLQRQPEGGSTLHALAISFAYALEDIPTHHLEECFRRAIQTSVSDFPIVAAAVLRAYQAMMPELQQQARVNATEQENLLKAGEGSLGRMSLTEWKTRHNLPAAWRLGDAYPIESDLHGKPVPKKVEQNWQCETCHDARWVKEYLNGPLYPQLRPCPRCG